MEDPTRDRGVTALSLLQLIAAGLAEIRQESVDELLIAMEDDPDSFPIDSKEGEAILARLEGDFGCKLVQQSDLKPEIMGSLAGILAIAGRATVTDA